MTDRDTFAAAALTGLLSNMPRYYQLEPLTRQAWEIADAMLRERCRGGGDCPSQDNVYCTVNHDAAPAARGDARECASPVTTGGKPAIDRLREWERHGSGRWGLGAAGDVTMLERRLAMVEAIVHDAAPSARASLPTADHAVCRGRDSGCGTGDTRESLSGSLPAGLGDGVSPSENDKNLHHTQEIAAYARFVGSVMNWISEATSAYASSCSSDGGRKIMADACCQCWDAFDRIAYPTIHGASPEARARTDAESDRTDKAAPRPGEGTGDTPKPIGACVSDRSKPINGPDPDSRVRETHTLATHATRGEGSEPREGAEPVAWGVAGLGGVLATSISRRDAVDMQVDYEFVTEVVPLYRQASDFAPPPPDNAAKAPDNAEPVAWAVCCPGDGNWSPCFFHEPHAQRHASAILGSKNVIPLYRQPPCPVCLAARSGHNFSQQNLTLTETEAETLRELRDEAAQYADEIGLTSSEIRARQRIIDGLLERLGGGR